MGGGRHARKQAWEAGMPEPPPALFWPPPSPPPPPALLLPPVLLRGRRGRCRWGCARERCV